MKEFPTLYSRGKNNELRFWQIIPKPDSIEVRHGVVGGKVTITAREVKGKNIGKANETSPYEQACLEAESKFKLKKRGGYSEEIPPEGEELLLPMLAHKYLDHATKLTPGCLVHYQPKLDGARMVAFWKNDEVVLTSRTGVRLDIPHLATEISKVLPKHMMLDGEVFIESLMKDCNLPDIDDDAFQSVMKLIKKKQIITIQTKPLEYVQYSSSDLEYHIYDLYNKEKPTQEYSERLKILQSMDNWTDRGHIRCIMSIPAIYVPSEVQDWHDYFVNRSYEGLIMRVDPCHYQLKHRSHQLLKYKNFYTDEFTIVGFKEGSGTRKGCVIWLVEASQGVTCAVAMKGSVSYQRELFDNAESYIGKSLTVKYQGRTADGSLRFPSGVDLREDWDT